MHPGVTSLPPVLTLSTSFRYSPLSSCSMREGSPGYRVEPPLRARSTDTIKWSPRTSATQGDPTASRILGSFARQCSPM
jgi:hypothetical protein